MTDLNEKALELAIEAARDRLEIDGDNEGPFIRSDSIDEGARAAIRAYLEAAAPPAPALPASMCQRCQGTGEIVTDWEKHMATNDEGVAECPDCDGQGTLSLAPALPADVSDLTKLVWQMDGPCYNTYPNIDERVHWGYADHYPRELKRCKDIATAIFERLSTHATTLEDENKALKEALEWIARKAPTPSGRDCLEAVALFFDLQNFASATLAGVPFVSHAEARATEPEVK